MSHADVPSNRDAPPRFELELSLPRDIRFAAIVRGLALQAAQCLGSADAAADAFGQAVEQIARDCLGAAAGPDVPVLVRHADGPLEVRIDTRTTTLDV